MSKLVIDANVFSSISHILDVFRRLDPNIPVIRVEIFLIVAANDGKYTIKNLEKMLNMTNAGASRNVAALTSAGYEGKPGLGLVQTFIDTEQRNRKIVQLSAKGKALSQLLLSLQAAETPTQEEAILEAVPEHSVPRNRSSTHR